jgi:hypothetical protein
VRGVDHMQRLSLGCCFHGPRIMPGGPEKGNSNL